MSKFEVGDLVKGLPESNHRYGITNENMTKGVVKKITEDGIVVKVLEHAEGRSGVHVVDEKYFEKIGHLESFDREKFLELLKESKAKAAEYLSGADLSDADLSGSQGLIDAINYMEAHFERTDEGYIVYKSFNSSYAAPDKWSIGLGEVIEEVANPDRTCECGCGINVAPLEWVKRDNCNQPFKLLIRWEWLPGVVVPYNTDGKIRCSKAQILEAVE